MCGIVGTLAFDGSTRTVDRALLERMRDVIAHRGPDGAGVWVSEDRKIGLGHRRLSIIDLSAAAAQPMCNEDKTIWVSFNGEIYNHADIRRELDSLGKHAWKTDHSDTEVIVRAFEQWGIDCLQRFRGMFAIALWDTRSRELWLVRDRVGVKPLYYAIRSGGISFASEIKALLADPEQPRALDEDALFEYLSFLTVPPPRTLFSGIGKLSPGCWMRVAADGSITERRYWDPLDHREVLTGQSDAAIAERVLAELRTAVRLRCVSDVPVGAFLSGGIDSTTNVALFAEQGSKVRTFTVGYRGQQTYQNETDQARAIAKRFHAEHHERLLGVDDLVEFLPHMVWSQDEPIADPVCVPIYYLSKLAREAGVTVCQVGEGADELFWGYPWWKTLRYLQGAGDLPVPPALKRSLLWALERAGRAETREYEFLRRSYEGVPVFWSGAEAFTGREKTNILSSRLRNRFRDKTGWDSLLPAYRRYVDKTGGQSALTWMTYSDLNLRLPELLLMRVDKMSMAVAVEGRVPFLDHRLVELAMNIPDEVKTRHGTLKHILKLAVRGLIPDETIARPKQGFGVPIQEWIFEKLGAQTKGAIREMVDATDIFDREAIERVFASEKGSRTWFLFNLALWWKRFLA